MWFKSCSSLVGAVVLLTTMVQAAKKDALAPTCSIPLDSLDPVHGLVRAGGDYSCTPTDGLDTCIDSCCNDTECLSFSFNQPWNLNVTYMGCIQGKDCCCLKNQVPPLEENKWPMNITSGAKPASPCVAEGVCCSLNGVVRKDNSTCLCDPGWTGNDCGTLDLIPASSLDGAYQTKVNQADCDTSCGPSSWGGLPLRDTDGTYHLFASQFVQNCTLKGWNPGSTVVRAVADNPMGPFVYNETIFGTFHHNPTVRRLSTFQSGIGKEMYVMLMIGDFVKPPVKSGAACGNGDTLDPHHLEGYIKMAWSDSLLGPWNYSHHTMITPGGVNDWDAMVTNPAPFYFDNGTSYIFYRGTEWPANGYERIGFVKASSWQGPYGRPFGSHEPLWDPTDTAAFVEDPFVWEDERGFHMLAHGHWDENGYLAFARRIEGPWYFRHKPTYTNFVTLEDGTTAQLKQRERPQLFMNETTGRPAILFTGVAPPWASFYGYTYTFAQKIRQ